MPDAGPILALDTASPVVSVAIADLSGILASRAVEISHSSRRLLEMVDESLAEAGLALDELAGIVALRGPGSFTGIRVGLATVLGLHQAAGLPATALPQFGVLAAQAPAGAGRVLAAVDVLRGEWAVQPFTTLGAGVPPRPTGPAERLAEPDLARFTPARIVAFGASRLGGLHPGLDPHEARPLAATAAVLACREPPVWSAERLTEPLYFRPPAVHLPAPRPA